MMRFRVSGYDDAGDHHIFETDDEDRARLMMGQFREELTNVTLNGTDVFTSER